VCKHNNDVKGHTEACIIKCNRSALQRHARAPHKRYQPQTDNRLQYDSGYQPSRARWEPDGHAARWNFRHSIRINLCV